MSRLLAYNSARARPPGSRAAHRRGQFHPGPENPRHARVRNHSGHLAEKRSGDPVRVWGPGSSTVETAYSVAMWLYEHASNDFSPQMRRRMIPRFLHASGDRGYVLLVPSALATSPLRLFSIVGDAGGLVLFYLVIGRIGDLHIPPPVAPARTDELWQHTCFEAFVRTSSGPGYYEFNFAPSTQWAAYWFDRYRSGMRVATEISAPHIEVRSSQACYRLQASLEMNQMSRLRIDGKWRIGLAAVIEETSGRKSYWALAHPPGKADFHHSDSFALEFS
jgi:hypothetical protein